MRYSSFRWIPVVVGLCLLVTSVYFTQVGAIAKAADGQPSFTLQPVKVDASNPQSKSYFIFRAIASNRLQNSVRVLNIGQAQGSVDLYAVDAITSPTTGLSYRNRAELSRDVGAWVTLSKKHLTLDPGKSQDVDFSVTVPHTVRAGQHIGAIIAENNSVQATAAKEFTTRLNVKKLTAIPIVVTVPGSMIEQLVVTNIQFDAKSAFQRLLVNLSNTGNMMVQPQGSLRILDSEGTLVREVPLQMNVILPQTSIRYPVNILKTALPVGKYTARLTLKYGKQKVHTLNYAATFRIDIAGPPAGVSPDAERSAFAALLASLNPWQYALAGALAALAGGFLFFWIFKLLKIFSIQSRRNRGIDL